MTAEEFVKSQLESIVNWTEFERKTPVIWYDLMRVFAKQHVQKALESAGEKAIKIQRTDNRKYVSKKAIINSYNLEDIK